MILGILMIGIQGILFTAELRQIEQSIGENTNITEIIETQIQNTQILSVILITPLANIYGKSNNKSDSKINQKCRNCC